MYGLRGTVGLNSKVSDVYAFLSDLLYVRVKYIEGENVILFQLHVKYLKMSDKEKLKPILFLTSTPPANHYMK